MKQLNEDDLRVIGYALEEYSVGTVWNPWHKQHIVQVLEKVKELQLNK
jgi:hypothetical protein